MRNFKEEESLHNLNHSCAHMMAQAVKHLYPDAKFWVGPVIDEGFYYDMDLGDKVITEEVNKCGEVKNITKINILSNGGIRKIDIDLKLQPKVKLVDLITFVVTLEDFLLKYSDLVSVNLVKHVNRSGARKNARNSGSTNSKKSTKKKSTKSKSKKR